MWKTSSLISTESKQAAVGVCGGFVVHHEANNQIEIPIQIVKISGGKSCSVEAGVQRCNRYLEGCVRVIKKILQWL